MTSKKANQRDEILGAWEEDCPQKLWRTHSDAVNADLLSRWLPAGQVERLLKTDLFDEAMGDGLYPSLTSWGENIIGIDLHFPTAHNARLRYPSFQTVLADVRYLPFSNGALDGIVSNSTLDHFESLDDLVFSLKEIHRVLRPSGQMILTLDNLTNPIILLRNRLPFRLLYRMKIVPYYVGVTLGPNHLQRLLREIGFKVLELNTVMHCPRVLGVATARLIQKHASPKIQRGFLSLLMAFERLSCLPTRFFTGHFIAVKLMKLSIK